MFDTFKRLADQILFAARDADPYLQSHPMPAERVAALERSRQDQPVLGQEGSARAAAAPRPDARQAAPASSSAATRSRAAIRSTDNSLPARYARAIATYRHSDLRAAIAQIDGLIQAQPNNPYFYELKGQALLEGGKPRGGDRAAAPRRHSSRPTPR